MMTNKEIKPITQDEFDVEFDEIVQSLESVNGVFCQLFELSRPVLTESIPTAAVGFDKTYACVSFEINPVYWNTLNKESKLFLICHECMHVILQHGERSKSFLKLDREKIDDGDEDIVSQLEAQFSNVSMDVVINETIVRHFGLNRSLLNFEEAHEAIKEYYDEDAEEMSEERQKAIDEANLPDIASGSFLDTVFGHIDPDIEYGKSYEYYLDVLTEYYDELIQKEQDMEKAIRELIKHIKENGMDSHEKIDSMGAGESGEGESGESGEGESGDGKSSPSEMIVREAMSGADEKDLKDLKEGLEKGYGKGYPGEPLVAGVLKEVVKLSYNKVKKQKKWQDLFRGHIKKVQEDVEDYQWVKKARRNAVMPPSFLLPSQNDTEARDDKWKVWLFIDSSGSCHHLQKQFIKAAYSIDLRYFDVRLFARTTQVEEIDYHNPVVAGSGSDDFRCIEDYIQDQLKMRKINRYPEIVMHFTDGYDCSGVMVEPQKPKNWWWFLAESSTKAWIPKECIEAKRVFKLSEYES